MVNHLHKYPVKPELFAAVTQGEDTGKLTVNVTAETDNHPIEGASVRVTYDGQPDRVIEETTTNEQGQIPDLELDAPPIDYSMEPGANKPYAEYTIYVSAPGYETLEVSGAEIFSQGSAVSLRFSSLSSCFPDFMPQ